MINKKQLDYFILKEASKVLREDLQADTQAINDEYDEKDEKEGETIRNKTISLSNGKTDKIYHSNKLAQETGSDSSSNDSKKKWQSMVNQDITKANNTKKELDDAKKRANELKKDRAEAIVAAKSRDSDEKSAESEASNEIGADSMLGFQ
jgi:hypothetical protein